VTDCFEHGNEDSSSIKYGEFVEQLRKHSLMKQDSSLCKFVSK